MFGKKNKDKDKVRNLRVVPSNEEAESQEAPETATEETAPEQNPVLATPGEGEQPELDELSEICRVAWCESFYRLAEGFSFKEEFIQSHLAPFMQQAGVEIDKLDDEDKARALITFSSYIICQSLAKPLESIGISKDSPQLYSQAIYQTITQAGQQAFVTIVDEYTFRTPFLPFANVFAQAVFKQDLEDVAIAYLFGPAYEITLRRALYLNKWITLPDGTETEEPSGDTDSEE